MGFQHTLYLQRDSEAIAGFPDEHDGTLYHWCSGARLFASSVRSYGSASKDDNEKVFFTPLQAGKLLAALTAELLSHYLVLMRGYDEFVQDIYWDEEMKADEKCLQSYAILRQMKNGLKDESFYYSSQFDELYKMEKIVKGLNSLIARMKEDDILVWELSF